MNDIDRYLDQACRSVSGSVALRKHLRDELKEHLEEAIKELVAGGISEEEAAKKVIEDFGEPEMVREGLQSVYGHSVTSFFIDKAMEWKERTMRSKWTWNSAIYIGLVLIIALAVSSIVFEFIWILPSIQRSYVEVDMDMPEYLIQSFRFANHIVNWWWIWLIVIVGGMGLFERKCGSENKSLIRTTMGVMASLVTVAFAFFLTAAIMINFTMMPRMRDESRSESAIITRVTEAHESYKQLTKAIRDKDWTVAGKSANELENAYQVLSDWDTMATVLASENQWDTIQDIRHSITEISELSDKLRDAIWQHDESSSVQDYYSQLEASFSELEKKSAFFAKYIDSESTAGASDP